jgi:hypothetical protein
MSKIALTGNVSGTGTLTIAAPNTNTDRTLTLPDEAGTVLTNTSGVAKTGDTMTGALVLDTAYQNGLRVLRDFDVSVSPAGQAIQFGAKLNGTPVYPIEIIGVTDTDGTAYQTEIRQDGNLHLQIDSAGRVTMPYQPHVFGCPTNTGGSGDMNNFHTETSQGGMSVSGTAITVPVTGLYLVTFNTICDTSIGRVDAAIRFSDGTVILTLSEDNGDGFHYRSASVVKKMSASDYVWFSNDDWYLATALGYNQWRTASVTLIG